MTPLHLDFHENRAFRGTSHGAGSDNPSPVPCTGNGLVRTGAFVDGDEGLARLGCGFFSGTGRPLRRGWALRGAGVWFVFFSHLALGNPVLDWSTLMLNAIQTETTAPTVSSRNLAILNVATYEAVNSIDRTHQPYRAYLEVQAGASPEAAVIAAGREVMRAVYPSMAARTEELYGKGLGALPDDVRRGGGVALGRLSAQRMIEARISDGSTTTVPYIPSSAPGQWQRTPPFFRKRSTIRVYSG